MATNAIAKVGVRVSRSLLSLALLLSLVSAFSISLPNSASAVGDPSLGSGGESFTVGKSSVTTINSIALTGSGQALKISNYPDNFTLQVTVATGGTGTVKITSTTGLTLVPGYQSALTAAAATIAFSGTTSDLNNALDTLQYVAPNANTNATLTVTTAVVGNGNASRLVYDAVDKLWYQYVPTPSNWYEAMRNIRNECGAFTGTYGSCTTNFISGVNWFRNWNDGVYTKSQYQFNGMNGIFAKIFNERENDAALAALKLGGGQGAWVGANNAFPRDAYYDANFKRSDRGGYNGTPVGVVGVGNWWSWRDTNSNSECRNGFFPPCTTSNGYISGIYYNSSTTYRNWVPGQPDVRWSDSDQAPTGGAVLVGENYFAGSGNGFTPGTWDDVFSHGNQSDNAYDTGLAGASKAQPFGYIVQYGSAAGGNSSGYAVAERKLNLTISGNAQSAIAITNTNVENNINATVQVTATGGSGTKNFQYSVTTTDGTPGVCVISAAGVLREANTNALPLEPATCSVRVTNPANGDYSVAVSEPFLFNFNPINQPDPIIITNSVTSFSTIGGTITLAASGGNGSGTGYGFGPGQYSFATQSSTCSISGRILTSIANGPCLVTATRAPSDIYAVATTQWPTYFQVFVFANLPASADITVTTYKADGITPIEAKDIKAGDTVTLQTNLTQQGGSNRNVSDLMNFTVYGTGCIYDSSTHKLSSPNGISYCTVLAYWDKAAPFRYKQSPAKLVTFNATSANPGLSIGYSAQPVAGTGLAITPVGGNGGVITWRVLGSGCSVSSPTTPATSAAILNVSQPTTCTIQATQQPIGIYDFTQSIALTINFTAIAPPAFAITTNTTAFANSQVNLTTNGGNGGVIAWTISGDKCSQPTPTTLLATGIAACVVSALQQPYGIYSYALATTVIQFGAASPTAISLSGPGGNSSGVAGSSFTVTASGGNTSTPAVPITWNFVGAACGAPAQSLRDLTFTPQVNGSCTITASQPGANGYAYVSATKTFSFSATSIGIPALTISRSGTPTALTNYSLSINGAGSPPAPTGNGNPVANWSFIGNAGNYCSFVGSANSVATLNVLASQPTTCVIQASQAPYGIYSYTQSQAITLTFVTAAAPPIVLATNTQPVAGDSVVVSIGSGGNGNPTVQYTVIGTDCSASSSGGGSSVTITTTGIAYCSVQALQAAYGAKSYAVSPSTALTFAPQNYSGTVSVTSTTGALPSIPFTLTNNASRSADKVSYVVSGAGCTYNAISKTITTAGGVNTYCSVLPFWAYGSPFNTAYYTPVTLSFALIPQTTAFTISNAITTARVNETITVTTRGGSGGGAIAFTSVSSKGKQLSDTGGSCNIVNNNGTATISSGYATTCSVTATKAAASQYQAAKTQTVLFTFIKP
jgi:hypothetical protein